LTSLLEFHTRLGDRCRRLFTKKHRFLYAHDAKFITLGRALRCPSVYTNAVIKKIWKDPVLSFVIGTGIVALITWASSGWLQSWATREISAVWRSSWSYLGSSTAVPHWLIFLFLILSVIVGLPTVIAVISNAFPNGKTSDRHWRSYTTDQFEGLR
jgi:hypothetical protein